MMDRRKSKQARSKKLNLVLKEDRLSELPDPLICHILSNLTIRDSVKTSVLSTRWRSLWLWVPSLKLNIWRFPSVHAFMSFGDRLFDYNSVSCIDSVKLYFDEHDASYLTSWIDALVKRKIQRLFVCRIFHGIAFEMPLRLFVCETLVSLELFRLTLNAEVVSLPCLKKMSLHKVLFLNEASFKRLVSCCLVLEDLRITSVIRKDGKVYRVHSRSLKRLYLERRHKVFDSVPGVVIDAPLLCDLRINDRVSESYVVSNLDSNSKLDIHLYFGGNCFGEESFSLRRHQPFIRSFLHAISKVMEMKISENTLKVIHHYSNSEPLPLFDHMSRLHVTLAVTELEWLPTFLESCPNLKSLIVALNDEMHSDDEMNQISFSSVPECLLYSLEFVNFDTASFGYDAEMKLVKYFLENSAILKKLTLYVKNRSTVYEKSLLDISRRSTNCQVILV